jgi:hypothetical protein
MKMQIVMELDAILRIACLLDHHRTECADRAEQVDTGGGSSSPARSRWTAQAGEASQLRETLLKSVSRAKSER